MCVRYYRQNVPEGAEGSYRPQFSEAPPAPHSPPAQPPQNPQLLRHAYPTAVCDEWAAASILLGSPAAAEYNDSTGFSRSHTAHTKDGALGEFQDEDSDPSSDAKNKQKRAANRKSAQLSRQRKKRYIEDLATEHSKLKVVHLITCLK